MSLITDNVHRFAVHQIINNKSQRLEISKQQKKTFQSGPIQTHSL